MNVPFFIAKRYLFSKKSHNVINGISFITASGVAIVTAALICLLSVFNGLNGLVTSLFDHFDPELKIVPIKGKVFSINNLEIDEFLKENKDIQAFSKVLEDNALFKHSSNQLVGVVKGVEDQYYEVTDINNVLIDGDFKLTSPDEVNYALIGVGVSSILQVAPGFREPLEVYLPKRNTSINLANPSSSFNYGYAPVAGIFRTDQRNYDENFVILPLRFVQKLFEYEDQISAIEIKLKNPKEEKQVQKELSDKFGPNFKVLNRFEQQKETYMLVQVEKWITFLIVIFFLIIALFNLVGSVSILMIEKRKDVKILQSLGVKNKSIKKLFFYEGWLISILGTIIGFVIGLLICFLQIKFGIIKFGNGNFLINAYPVKIEIIDLIITLVIVIGIGHIAAWLPIHFLSNKWIVESENNNV